MKEYENEWVQLKAGQHGVRYSTLPAGDYEFEVKNALPSELRNAR